MKAVFYFKIDMQNKTKILQLEKSIIKNADLLLFFKYFTGVYYSFLRNFRLFNYVNVYFTSTQFKAVLQRLPCDYNQI